MKTRSSSYASSARDMERIGMDVCSVDQKKIATRRRRKGECVSCGEKLFKMGLWGTKTALTVPDRVKNGRCLSCFPLEMDNLDSICVDEVPHVLRIRQPLLHNMSDDTNTIVSGITMDHRLFQNDEIANDDSSEEEEYVNSEGLTRTRNANQGQGQGRPPHQPRRTGERKEATGGLVATRKRSIAWTPSVEDNEKEETKTEIEATDDPVNIAHWSHSEEDDSKGLLERSIRVSNLLEVKEKNSSQIEIHVEPGSLPMETVGPILEIGRDKPVHSLAKTKKHQTPRTRRRKLRLSAQTMIMARSGPPVFTRTGSGPELDEITALIKQLQSSACNRATYISALIGLASIVWAHGAPAKRLFKDKGGIAVLTTAIWADIDDPVVQGAALRLLLALSASRDSDPASDVISSEHGEGCVDAMLFAMQSLTRFEEIQELGLKILCCLASASANNPAVNDGSLSGAVGTVLKAMAAHPKSHGVHDWGSRALYHQCVFSRHAEANKRTLARSTLESGGRGEVVLKTTMAWASSDPVFAERLADLFWCLTASEDVAQMLSPAGASVSMLMSIAAESCEREDSSTLMEAVLGAVSNFAKVPKNNGAIDANGVISLAFEIMLLHSSVPGVVTEACSLVANLAPNSEGLEDIIDSTDLQVVFDAVARSEGPPLLQEEAMRALVCLADSSVMMKNALLDSDLYTQLMNLRRQYEISITFQTLYCRLLASLSRSAKAYEGSMLTDIVCSLCLSMSQHSDVEKVQQAACSALRVITANDEGRESVNSNECVRAILAAMEQHRKCRSIQLDGCLILWQLTLASEDLDEADGRSMDALASAMQSHLEDVEILDVAISALWAVVRSLHEVNRRIPRSSRAVDAVSCVIVMHPADTSLLDKALSLLALLSANPQLASSQRIDVLIDIILRSGTSHPPELLLAAVMYIRNAVTLSPSQASEASGSICPVIEAMKEYKDETEFQREACNLLWLLAATSSENKAKILALDGIAMLIETLERNPVPSLQDAALGAFNELALTAPSN